jgi:DNA-damage-inducible protein J
MTGSINVTIRLDKEIKEKAEKLFDELGMSFSTAVNVFARRAINKGGIPFSVEKEEKALSEKK